jgi:hypothetical protein
MAQEFRAKGVNIALGPVVGPLGRVATGGRNWEGKPWGLALRPSLKPQLLEFYTDGGGRLLQ